MRLLFQISVLLLTLQRGTSTDSCLPGDLGKIRLTGPRSIKNEGAVQLCLVINGNEYIWFYIASQDGWTNNLTAATLACTELGLSYTRVRVSTVQLTKSAATVTSEIDCSNEDQNVLDCLPHSLSAQYTDQVAGLICNCTEGTLRLVDGSSHNEGRVEVCFNGRWGTVCGDGWTEREAALVCSRLGYPILNTTLSNFGEGSGPLYNITCPSTGSDDQECIPIITTAPSSCNHSMDVGVKCLPFNNACAVPVTEMTSNNRQPPISTETSGPSDGTTCESNGPLIGGTSAAALVVVVAGWIASCVYFQRKINKHHTHSTPVSTNNPTLQHTPQDEGDQALYDTINDTVTNLDHNDTVQCVQNESYSLAGQRKMDTLN